MRTRSMNERLARLLHTDHSGARSPERPPRSVVVTGAASGIGRALAVQLAARGDVLHLSDVDARGLAETVALIPGSIASSTVVDITDYAAVRDWATLISETGIDELYHVAGIAIWGDARRMPHEKWQKVIDVNLMGTIHMVEAFIPAMASEKPRTRTPLLSKRPPLRPFVCVSSAAGIIGLPWHAAYSASKAGVIGLGEVLRFDLRPYGVSMHVAAPGAVDTPLVQTIDIDGVDPTASRIGQAKRLFQRHAVSPEEAAEKILRGVSRGRFLIYTSPDIPLARWAQVNTPWLYSTAMRGLNRAFRWAARSSST